MSPIHQCLSRLADERIGTVIHVNPAGSDLMDRYIALGARRVVLVSGDPDVVLEVRRAAQGQPAVEVLESVVSARSGPAQWLRFNVRELNGMLEPRGLRDFYPRLQLLERVSVTASDLQTLLDRLKVEHGHAPNLLILEAPGMDAGLVESLSSDTLRQFDWIIIRGASEGLYEGGSAHAAASEELGSRFYRAVAQQGDIDPLWPTTMLRYDHDAAERDELARRVEALQEQLASLQQAHRSEVEQLALARDEKARIAAACEAQLQALLSSQVRAETLARQRLEQLEQLKNACEEQVKLAAEREAEAQALKQGKAEAHELAQDRHVQIAQLTKERDELANLASGRGAEISALAEERAQAQNLAQERLARIEQLTTAHDDHARLAVECAAQLQSLAADKAEAQQMAQERLALIEQLAKASDEHARFVAECEARLQALSEGKAQAERLAQERQVQVEQLTKARDERAKAAAELDGQVQALTHAKGQAEKLAQDRQAQIELLAKGRDEQAKVAAERHKRLTQLDAEVIDLSARYGMLQEELVKAEAHVELISDLVLRDALR
jgi:hypothetical protein